MSSQSNEHIHAVCKRYFPHGNAFIVCRDLLANEGPLFLVVCFTIPISVHLLLDELVWCVPLGTELVVTAAGPVSRAAIESVYALSGAWAVRRFIAAQRVKAYGEQRAGTTRI